MEAMAATDTAMARGRLRLATAMAVMVMVATDTAMARERLRLATAMAVMVMVATDMAMARGRPRLAMAMEVMDTATARGPPRQSPATDTVMATVTATATMVEKPNYQKPYIL